MNKSGRKANTSKIFRVYEKTGGKCFYCGGDNEICIDHVTPKSKGGSNHVDNLVAACRSCNGSKGAKNLEEYRMHMMVKGSKYGGVINAIQASDLIELGVELDLSPHAFWAELREVEA